MAVGRRVRVRMTVGEEDGQDERVWVLEPTWRQDILGAVQVWQESGKDTPFRCCPCTVCGCHMGKPECIWDCLIWM